MPTSTLNSSLGANTGVVQSIALGREASIQLDHHLSKNPQTPAVLLMKRAAWFAFSYIQNTLLAQNYQNQSSPSHHPGKLVVLAGLGNNGGDGIALAQYALLQGLSVDLFLFSDLDNVKSKSSDGLKLAHPADLVFEEWQQLEQNYTLLSPSQSLDYQPLKDALKQADGIVDALFGVGLNRPLSSAWQGLIELVNQQSSKIVSLDIASGLDASTGSHFGAFIQSQHTVWFITPKLGHFTHFGRDSFKQLTGWDLGLAPYLQKSIQALKFQTHQAVKLLKWSDCKQQLSQRTHQSHKGSYGKVLVIAGGEGMAGACALASLSAQVAGTGLVKILTHPSHQSSLITFIPEAIQVSLNALEKTLNQFDAEQSCVVLGCGLGQSKWAKAVFALTFKAFQQSSTLKMVVDGDGLYWWRQYYDLELKNSNSPHSFNPNHSLQNRLVLTPHPKEAAYLLDGLSDTNSINNINHNRPQATLKLADKYGQCVVLLKGSGTVIATHQSPYPLSLNTEGNALLASAGVGDSLAGLIASLISQGMNTAKATEVAVSWQSQIAEVEIQSQNHLPLKAYELIERMRGVVGVV